MMYTWTDGTYLAHHGIKGQKWGVRRFQNEDGSLTSAGRTRYGVKERASNVANRFATSAKYAAKGTKMAVDRAASSVKNKWNGLSDKQRTAIKVGAAVAVSALAAYGAYKYSEGVKNEAFNRTVNMGYDATERLLELAERQATHEYIWDNNPDYHNREAFTNSSTGGRGISDLRGYLMNDVYSTAHDNSRTFRQARRTLKGDRKLSVAELERAGISTVNPGLSSAGEETLNKYRRRDRFWD